MSKVADGKFNCDACGKRFTWKPALAGKRAKCSCGAVMTVPEANEEPEAPLDDELYDVADAPSEPLHAPPLPAAPAPVAVAAKTLNYHGTATQKERDRFAFDALTHPPRDLYIPTGLLIAGFLGIFAWGFFALDATTFGMIIISASALIATLVKTTILIIAAFIFAPVLGISFGDARTAILKFAGIVVFVDAVGLWYDEIVTSAGAITHTGRRGRGVTFIWIMLASLIISCLCYYLFDMDSEETGYFAIPFAIASLVIGWVLKILAVAIVAGMLA